MKTEVDLSKLKGCKIKNVDGLESGSDSIVFTLNDGRKLEMMHYQDCCENVLVDDVCGDAADLIGFEIVHFEERTNIGDEDSDDKPSEYSESFTWTFYDIQTTKGCVNIKWLGESNGYYSESVYVEWLSNNKDNK